MNKISLSKHNGAFLQKHMGNHDGIGGIVKRVVSKASLQHVNDNHLLDFPQMYNFCKDKP